MFSFFSRKYRDAETKFADLLTRFAGSMAFVYIHIIWFIIWIIFAKQIGDPFPFGLLTMIVSLEAIFLATFIMVSQNRQAEILEERASEEDEEQEEIQEDIEDIQEDFDELQRDLAEVRRIIEKIESRASGQEPLPSIKAPQEKEDLPAGRQESPVEINS
ncbi:MAG: hypothetical protein A3F35_02950 [Candidatus Woykebacteria bacterium RIFCSPHIGHO2_12_FULL_45_10]|uniref:DUF1003 domain-containing protein n=1 Tax=Candidatus Woykebacteria bacterium RIFCSPHIGHO2_12_FULL_45_10 TaxID=1802603 RepID=A0A1G1WQV0_9BACT|nr:MAG: hypothetical protein A3F35_02950 [Candidatus Woykebacteria bacterium RIFCSPHIGHO2_12_FULL_45_10]